jgi:hypothetical protein
MSHKDRLMKWNWTKERNQKNLKHISRGNKLMNLVDWIWNVHIHVCFHLH